MSFSFLFQKQQSLKLKGLVDFKIGESPYCKLQTHRVEGENSAIFNSCKGSSYMKNAPFVIQSPFPNPSLPIPTVIYFII